MPREIYVVFTITRIMVFLPTLTDIDMVEKSLLFGGHIFTGHTMLQINSAVGIDGWNTAQNKPNITMIFIGWNQLMMKITIRVQCIIVHSLRITSFNFINSYVSNAFYGESRFITVVF